jgi:hypothetical protein
MQEEPRGARYREHKWVAMTDKLKIKQAPSPSGRRAYLIARISWLYQPCQLFTYIRARN